MSMKRVLRVIYNIFCIVVEYIILYCIESVSRSAMSSTTIETTAPRRILFYYKASEATQSGGDEAM